MPAKPANALSFDASSIGPLACPACYASLRLEDLCLICSACARRYPIVDGIPVLIVERAESVTARDT